MHIYSDNNKPHMKNDEDGDPHCCDKNSDDDPPYSDEDGIERTLPTATKTALRESSLLRGRRRRQPSLL
ncbi:uncharacterized protein DS421_19g645570 [Arachis hypogaea]|uniref:Uncharacterized protein n=1 Tax=Arachis hypogaea TaxID=3818 RepID=A0A6B9V5E1_ARAHY|nr:uncharacterized protein DS421_19g645570 [Arachis hypogaea]